VNGLLDGAHQRRTLDVELVLRGSTASPQP
jgi:hypothetical protein